MTNEDIAQRASEVQFAPVRIQAGYDMSDVDAFLDSVVEVAEDQAAVRALIEGARFRTTRMREGYWMQAVDDFLASLVDGPGERSAEQSVAGPRGAPAAPHAAAPQPPASYTGAIQETQSLWSRLFGRKG